MHNEDVVDFDTSCQFGQFKKWGRNNARQKYKTLLLTLKTMQKVVIVGTGVSSVQSIYKWIKSDHGR